MLSPKHGPSWGAAVPPAARSEGAASKGCDVPQHQINVLAGNRRHDGALSGPHCSLVALSTQLSAARAGNTLAELVPALLCCCFIISAASTNCCCARMGVGTVTVCFSCLVSRVSCLVSRVSCRSTSMYLHVHCTHNMLHDHLELWLMQGLPGERYSKMPLEVRCAARSPSMMAAATARVGTVLALQLLMFGCGVRAASTFNASIFPPGTELFHACDDSITGNTHNYLHTITLAICTTLAERIRKRVLLGRTNVNLTCVTAKGRFYLETQTPEDCAEVTDALQERLLDVGVSGVQGLKVSCAAASSSSAPLFKDQFEYWLAFSPCEASINTYVL